MIGFGLTAAGKVQSSSSGVLKIFRQDHDISQGHCIGCLLYYVHVVQMKVPVSVGMLLFKKNLTVFGILLVTMERYEESKVSGADSNRYSVHWFTWTNVAQVEKS